MIEKTEENARSEAARQNQQLRYIYAKLRFTQPLFSLQLNFQADKLSFYLDDISGIVIFFFLNLYIPVESINKAA